MKWMRNCLQTLQQSQEVRPARPVRRAIGSAVVDYAAGYYGLMIENKVSKLRERGTISEVVLKDAINSLCPIFWVTTCNNGNEARAV